MWRDLHPRFRQFTVAVLHYDTSKKNKDKTKIAELLASLESEVLVANYVPDTGSPDEKEQDR